MHASLLILAANLVFAQPPQAMPITTGPNHHFFGYYDVTPYDATGRYVLANEIDFVDRQPKPGEVLTVGMVDLQDKNRYIRLGETTAWCWQMGCRLQWLGSAPDREVIFNVVDGDRYAAKILDVKTGQSRILPRPIYALSRDGKQALTLDFDRLGRLRPGYGYVSLPEKNADQLAPKDMGIYWMDVKTGESKLILSYAWAAQNQSDKRFLPTSAHWFNHLLFNPSGDRFVFLHRWKKADNASWYTRMYVARPDGSEPKLVFDDDYVSHFDWKDDDHILAWARTKERGDRFHLINVRTGDTTVIGDGVLTKDGHCSYHPRGRWILNDTYPDAKRMQALMLFDPVEKKKIDLGQFLSPKEFTGPVRCDLHPRFNRDGTKVCIDATPTGMRQMYIVDVNTLVK